MRRYTNKKPKGTVTIGEHSSAKTRNAPDNNDIEKFILLMAKDYSFS
jgi:hypothetical protein